jgi:GxxExxY protein
MNTDDAEFGGLSERIIECAFAVSNTRGAGFVAKVYENALAFELRRVGVSVEQQAALIVRYEGGGCWGACRGFAG